MKRLPRLGACCLLPLLLSLGAAAQPETAGQQAAEAIQLATAAVPDVALTAVATDSVGADGEAARWYYAFASPDTALVVVNESGTLRLDPTGGALLGLDLGALTNLGRPLPETWTDSDDAIASAERRYGAEFRATYPDARTAALLLSPDVSDPQLEQLLGDASWIVLYFDNATGASMAVVPASFLTIQFETQTALGPLDNARATARNALADDAQLVEVSNLLPLLSIEGEALMWRYTFYSPSLVESRDVITLADLVVSTTEPLLPPLSAEPLPDNLLDTDAVLPAAEPASADFRATYDPTTVIARLSTGINAAAPEQPYYAVTYGSPAAAAPQTVFVDAITGDVSTVATEAGDLPSAHALGAPYPNPFNPEASIPYTLAAPGHVDLAVYDLVGRRVRTLYAGVQPAGAYTATFAAGDLPSGVYLVRLIASGTAYTRRAVLLR